MIREIRFAFRRLGAQRADVMRLVIGRALKLVAFGSAIGLLMALFSRRALQVLLYRVSALDLPTFFVVTFVLGLVAFAASYVPAQRATRADPMIALSHNA
jgi:putative ABC transport system permease protein